jgi:prevent-host-death family protein
MRQIALYEAKNTLSLLIADVEASGEEIVITRHGTPAAKLVPIIRLNTPDEKSNLLSRLAANRDAWGHQSAKNHEAVSWENIKDWMDEDR